jgi:hypothetical protein
MKMKILQGDASTPLLKDLQAALKPGSAAGLKLRQTLAGSLERLTRDHITKASKTRHKTADRLSAKRTGYLEKKEGTVESHVTGNADGLIRISVYGDIFSRVDGPVSVKPRTKKWLAIPNTAEAYGRRPRELKSLRFILIKKGFLAALVRDIDGPPGPDGRQPSEVIYWLKKGVTLPQDRGLLPTEAEFLKAMESGAGIFLDALDKQSQGKGFSPPKRR